MSKLYTGTVNSSVTYNVTTSAPLQDDIVFDSQLDLFNMLYPHFGKIVTIVKTGTHDGVYVLTADSNTDIKVNRAKYYLLDEYSEEKEFTYDSETRKVTSPGISHRYGWKKIGEGSGGEGGIDVEDNGGATTKGTTINNDGDVTGTVENGSITLNIDWSKIECICGGNSVTGGTTITDTDGTGLTIDNYTLKTNGDGKEDTEDDNIIYVAQTDGGTWDKTE